jgi:hypothetical protein
MKVKFKQDTLSGCGSYSLANLFNDERFLEGIKDLKVGERMVDLNKKMDKFFPEGYIDTLFLTQSQFTQQPSRLADPLVFEMKWEDVKDWQKEIWARPFLVTFKRTKDKCHCILVILNLKNNLLYVVDSLKEDIQKFEVQNFINQYHIISVENFGLWDMERPEDSMFIYKNHFPHLFEEID